MKRGVTVLSQAAAKRSACRSGKRFKMALVIPLYLQKIPRFPALTGRLRLPRPAAAKAEQTPDRVQSADARLRRDSSAWPQPFYGQRALRKTASETAQYSPSGLFSWTAAERLFTT